MCDCVKILRHDLVDCACGLVVVWIDENEFAHQISCFLSGPLLHNVLRPVWCDFIIFIFLIVFKRQRDAF